MPILWIEQRFNAFLPQEVMKQAQEFAYNYAVEQLNQAFGKMAKSVNRRHGIVKMTYKPLKKKEVSELHSHEGMEEILNVKTAITM